MVGAPADPITVPTPDLIFGIRTITGSLTGSSIDNEDGLRFSQSTGIHPITDVRPLTDAADASAHMMSGNARFRVVLEAAA